MRRRPPSPRTLIFLIALGLTTLVWILRGFRILSFIPGGVLVLLLLFCLGTGIVSSFQD